MNRETSEPKAIIHCFDCGKYLGSARNGGVPDQREPFGIELAPRGKLDGQTVYAVYASYCLDCAAKHTDVELLLFGSQTAETVN
jgi:hypothetical protein